MMRRLLVKDLLSQLHLISGETSRFRVQQNPEYLEWVSSKVVDFVKDFVHKNKLQASHFIKNMNNIFNTDRFDLLLKRWVLEYLVRLFNILHDFTICQFQLGRELVLEDNPLNRFGVEKYYSRFGVIPEIKWKKGHSLSQKIFSILLRCLVILYISLNKGVRISGKLKKYKIMRESIWGLYDTGGYYFHDDFLVDGDKIKKEDIILFSRGRGGLVDIGRLKAYDDAERSPYSHFDIVSLPLGLGAFFSRIIPKYIVSSTKTLFKEISSGHFSLYWSIYSCFIYNALPYEKVFSHFKIVSELGHHYYSCGHIVEAIVCQNYGTRYYLMHWSDHSVTVNKYFLAFLGCDGFLSWGKVHIQGVEGDPSIFMSTGYVFKRFIKQSRFNRDKILYEMGVRRKGKIITFFDESFGADSGIREENYITFWEILLRLAKIEQGNTILIKQKAEARSERLSSGLKKRFIDIKADTEKMPNAYILQSERWSFIECIGISDIVVTLGMNSSSTIAIICGVEALYFNEDKLETHPFFRYFKDRIVFEDPERLLSMIQKIIAGKENPMRDIPEKLVREFDEYSDDRGIDLFKDILAGEKCAR